MVQTLEEQRRRFTRGVNTDLHAILHEGVVMLQALEAFNNFNKVKLNREASSINDSKSWTTMRSDSKQGGFADRVKVKRKASTASVFATTASATVGEMISSVESHQPPHVLVPEEGPEERPEDPSPPVEATTTTGAADGQEDWFP